ncbi:hypothetical protein V1525DRAFT_177933 [Lipomyces kononenkoae]|uniref:Uncharacterized protein n=1 Tax=Lipomyces kononenkoae TaxID=34357 RepID=A0ACC3TAK4_LIPKO
MVVGGHEWNQLIDVTKEEKIWTALPFSKRRGDCIYMSQALVSDEGETVIHRNCDFPGLSETWLAMVRLRSMSMVECGEHFYPAMTFTMASQRPRLHIGAFPYVTDYNDAK